MFRWPFTAAAMSKASSAGLDDKLLHFAHVGVLASRWAAMEIFIDALAINLGGVPTGVGLCFTAQVIGISRKLDAYLALARMRGAKKALRDLEAFRKEALSLGERRNRIVHDPWTFKDGIPRRFEISARRRLIFGDIPISTDKIGKLIGEIEDHHARFRDLHQKVLAEIGT